MSGEHFKTLTGRSWGQGETQNITPNSMTRANSLDQANSFSVANSHSVDTKPEATVVQASQLQPSEASHQYHVQGHSQNAPHSQAGASQGQSHSPTGSNSQGGITQAQATQTRSNSGPGY